MRSIIVAPWHWRGHQPRRGGPGRRGRGRRWRGRRRSGRAGWPWLAGRRRLRRGRRRLPGASAPGTTPAARRCRRDRPAGTGRVSCQLTVLVVAAALVFGVPGGERVVVDQASLRGLVLGGDDVQVVDAGGGRRAGIGLLGAGFGGGVTADALGDGQPVGRAVPAHLHAGQVERVEDQLDGPPGQDRVYFVGGPEQLDGGGLADLAVLGPQERLAQLRRRGDGERRGGQPPLQRRLP